MASALCSPPPPSTAQHPIDIETPDVLLRRLKVLEVEASPANTMPRLSWEEDPVTWLVHELLYCCQAREQQEFDATYEDVSAMLHRFMSQNQSLEAESMTPATRSLEFAKMLASLIKRISQRGQMQAVNDFLLSKLEHVVAVLAPHATARPVADLLEAMSQGVSSFRMEHDIKATMTVFPCVVRFARALIRAMNDSFNSAIGFSEHTFNAQCQLLATAFSTVKDGMRVLLDAQHPPRETLEALRRAPELPSRLGAPARAQLFKCLLHESAPALLLTALKLEACGELEYLPTVLLDILRHGTRFAGAQIHLLQRALHRRSQEDQSEQAAGSRARPGSCGLLQLSKLLGVLRAALHLQQICNAPSVQWQRLEQLLLHEVRDSAGISSGSLCNLLWAFVRYRSHCSMVMQHAMYVLKTCVAQAERLPRVLHQIVEDHKMLDVTAGILHCKLQAPSPEVTDEKRTAGAPDLAAFCEGLVPCVLDHAAAITRVLSSAEVQSSLEMLRHTQKLLYDNRVPWEFDKRTFTSKTHQIAKQVLATLKDSPMVPETTASGSDLPPSPGPADTKAQTDDAKPATPEPATQPRSHIHSRPSGEEQPAGARKPGRSRGSERPPPGPLSPNPGRPLGFSRDVHRRSLERPERASRPVPTMERSRSASSLSSRGTYSPGPRSSGRLVEKDGKGSSQGQISIRVDAHGQRSMLPPVSGQPGRDQDSQRHRRSKSEQNLQEMHHGRHARSSSQPLSAEVLTNALASQDAGHLLSNNRSRSLEGQT